MRRKRVNKRIARSNQRSLGRKSVLSGAQNYVREGKMADAGN